MSALSAMGLIAKDAQVYRVWTAALSDIPEANIRNGLNLAKDYTEHLTLPKFRELCLSCETPNHPMYKALPKEVYIPASPEVAKERLSKIKDLLN